jgi:hypothetical protein
MSKTSPILVGLEIGTSKICSAIGEENERGEFTLLGIGQSKSHGVRKGEIVHGTPELVDQIKAGEEPTAGGVVTIDAMPSETDLKPGLEIVDMSMLKIGVHKETALHHRAELIELLKGMSEEEKAIFRQGPSYIHVGGMIGDQGAAFQLFALGKVLYAMV